MSFSSKEQLSFLPAVDSILADYLNAVHLGLGFGGAEPDS